MTTNDTVDIRVCFKPGPAQAHVHESEYQIERDELDRLFKEWKNSFGQGSQIGQYSVKRAGDREQRDTVLIIPFASLLYIG